MVQLEEFGALGLTDVTLEAIKAKGFETPSPIQKLTIPVLLDDEKKTISSHRPRPAPVKPPLSACQSSNDCARRKERPKR